VEVEVEEEYPLAPPPILSAGGSAKPSIMWPWQATPLPTTYSHTQQLPLPLLLEPEEKKLRHAPPLVPSATGSAEPSINLNRVAAASVPRQ
jgi:hypothetical protein